MVHTLLSAFPRARFAPPATEEDIAAAEAALGVRLPEQLRSLYLVCNGFREDRGNAEYLFLLADTDFSGSLVSTTKFLWAEFDTPDLRPFVFFGSSSGDENWGINLWRPEEVIAFHHHMEDQYEIVGSSIMDVYQADYKKYDIAG